MSDKHYHGGGGIGLGGLLTIAFVILKLCGVIKWSWWAVLAPTWAPLALVLVVLGICALANWIFN